MAYVAITERLIASVKHNIGNMAQAERKSDPMPAPDKLVLSEEDWLRRALWGPLYGTEFEGHERLSIAAGWSAQFVITDMGGPSAQPNRSIGAFTCSVEGPWPRHALVNKDGKMTASGYYGAGHINIFVKREQHKSFDEWCKWYERSQEIAQRWKKIEVQIEAYLRECKSLNQAVKLWPDITRYLDQEDRRRLEAETQKTKSSPEKALEQLGKMDIEQITASTVLARLISADKS